jgi:hypothetical protein
MTLRLDTRLFTLAKDPEQPEAFQDACCVDTDHHIFAIADGVSSALFSGPWAAILAEAAVADSPNPHDADEFGEWLQRQRQRWEGSIDTSNLAWFQKAKLPQGAFSTLLYIRICPAEADQPGAFGGHRLVAFALGDSCLFHLRGGELVRSFPLERSEQFQADPVVLGSIDLKRDHLLEFAILDEMCYPGDEFVLCTDAVAEWAARSYETGDPPVWNDFWLMSEDDWRSGVAWLRQERQMRVDDATMLLLKLVDERAELAPSSRELRACPVGKETDGQSHDAASENDATDDDPSGLEWLREAAKDVKSVSGQIAEHADQTSERVIRGLISLKDRAMQTYRDKFQKDKKPQK